MYAVIKTGGKQYRVEEGQRLEVELLRRDADDDEIDLTPVLLVDGDTVLAGPTALGTSRVTARVVGEAKGPKITGFTYKPKTNNRRRWGHRQRYSTVEITSISMTGAAGAGRSASKSQAEPASKGTAKAAAKGTAKAAVKSPATGASKGQAEPASKGTAKAAAKSGAKKGTAKASAAKKGTAKRSTAKKGAAKKGAAKKSSAKKSTAKKSAGED